MWRKLQALKYLHQVPEYRELIGSKIWLPIHKYHILYLFAKTHLQHKNRNTNPFPKISSHWGRNRSYIIVINGSFPHWPPPCPWISAREHDFENINLIPLSFIMIPHTRLSQN